MHILFSISCSFLLAAGLLFVLIELYTNYDKVFRHIGFGLIILALMAGVDIWIVPDLVTLESKLYWQRILHVLTGFAALVTVKQVSILTKNTSLVMEKMVLFLSLIISVMVVSTNMLQIRGTSIVGNWLYLTLFIPYILTCTFLFTYPVYKRLQKGFRQEKRILNFQLYGMLILVFFGCLDMFQFLKPAGSNFPSYKVIGILIYGVMNALIFAEHFLDLLRDRDENKKRLETAYAELLQSNSLKQLGESSAIINHEIKNYMFIISGNAQLMKEMDLVVGKGKDLVNNIISSVERLQKFSMDILELSRTHIIQDKKHVSLSGLLKKIVYEDFAKKMDLFEVSGLDSEYAISGDWDKLHQVFTNLFGNAMEAAHPDEPLKISVKISGTSHVVLCTIEDNGIGCNQEQFSKMFTAFFTTKNGHGKKGTGLGLAISRTIIESHGGRISLYSKNLLENSDQHGVKFQIAFPNFTEDTIKELDRKHPIFVIKAGLPDIAGVIRVFQNVYVTPYFVQDIDELLQKNFQREAITILASAETIKSHHAKLRGFGKLCLINHHNGSLFVFEHGGNKMPVHFSEDYVMNHLSVKTRQETKVPDETVPIPIT